MGRGLAVLAVAASLLRGASKVTKLPALLPKGLPSLAPLPKSKEAEDGVVWIARNNHYEKCERRCGTKKKQALFESDPYASRLVLFVHFHKAGGTSFCRLLKDAKLKEMGYNCGCNFKRWVPRMVRQKGERRKKRTMVPGKGAIGPEGTARKLADEMARNRADVCMLERGYDFPPPDEFRNFSRAWRALGGTLATVFREPWARFKSTYERDYGDFQLFLSAGKRLEHGTFSDADYNRSANATIADFAGRDFRETPMGHHAMQRVFRRPPPPRAARSHGRA